MATTALTIDVLPGLYSTTGQILDDQAPDVANGNHFDFSGDVMYLIANNTGGSAYTITITSVAGPVSGRTGDVNAESLAAGEIRIFRLARQGWANSSGQVAVSVSNVAVQLSVLRA